MKVKELFELWLNKYTKPSVKLRTYVNYEYKILNFINPFIGELKLKSITDNLILDYVNELLSFKSNKTNKQLSINTINGIVQILKNGFLLAINLNLINKNPTLNIKLPKISQKEVTALTREEQKKIENYCLKSHRRNYLGIILCLYTGIRIGELLALSWDDIDFNKKLLYIRKTVYSIKKDNQYKMVIDKPKTIKSNRVIPIPDKLLELLISSKKYSKSKYVITTNKNKMVETRSYQRSFKSILKKCNIKQYSFHSLRHTFATRALEIGVDIKTLSELLGHTDVNITLNRYVHSLFQYKIQEMDRISELL